MSELNQQLFFKLHALAGQSVFMDSVINFLASDLILYLSGFLLLFFISHKIKSRGFREFLVVFSAGLLSLGIATIGKIAFNTERPFLLFANIQPLFITSLGAFPSGHTAFFMALGAALFRYHRVLALFIMLMALVIGIARVIAGVHFPIDILGGAIIGLLVGTLAPLLYTKRT